MHVPYQVERMDPSSHISALSSPFRSRYFELFLYGNDVMQQIYHQILQRESAELFIPKFIHCCRHGIMVSKHWDPRLSNSMSYVIMTPFSQDLRDVCIDRMIIDLLYNSNYHLENLLLAKRRSEEV